MARDYCNSLTIKALDGPVGKSELKRFVSAHKLVDMVYDPSRIEHYIGHHQFFSFKTLVPLPEGYPDESGELRRELWGCEWDAMVNRISVLDDRVTLDFITLYSPPIQWLVTASTLNPNLEFRNECWSGSLLHATIHELIVLHRGKILEHVDYLSPESVRVYHADCVRFALASLRPVRAKLLRKGPILPQAADMSSPVYKAIDEAVTHVSMRFRKAVRARVAEIVALELERERFPDEPG